MSGGGERRAASLLLGLQMLAVVGSVIVVLAVSLDTLGAVQQPFLIVGVGAAVVLALTSLASSGLLPRGYRSVMKAPVLDSTEAERCATSGLTPGQPDRSVLLGRGRIVLFVVLVFGGILLGVFSSLGQIRDDRQARLDAESSALTGLSPLEFIYWIGPPYDELVATEGGADLLPAEFADFPIVLSDGDWSAGSIDTTSISCSSVACRSLIEGKPDASLRTIWLVVVNTGHERLQAISIEWLTRSLEPTEADGPFAAIDSSADGQIAVELLIDMEPSDGLILPLVNVLQIDGLGRMTTVPLGQARTPLAARFSFGEDLRSSVQLVRSPSDAVVTGGYELEGVLRFDGG